MDDTGKEIVQKVNKNWKSLADPSESFVKSKVTHLNLAHYKTWTKVFKGFHDSFSYTLFWFFFYPQGGARVEVIIIHSGD